MATNTHAFRKDETFNADQRTWLRNAHRLVVRLLERNETFTAPDFWKANTKGDYPRITRYDSDNRIFGRVIRQIIADGLMADANPGWGKRVAGTGTFKPVYTSLIHKAKVEA
jgi:hypothetical protein